VVLLVDQALQLQVESSRLLAQVTVADQFVSPLLIVVYLD
jgi:hypothetical protein